MNEEDRKKYFDNFIKNQLKAENQSQATENYKKAEIQLKPTEYNQLIYFEVIFKKLYSREQNKKFRKGLKYEITDEEYNAIFEEAYNKSNLDERSENHDGKA